MEEEDVAGKETERQAAPREKIDAPGRRATFGEGAHSHGRVGQEEDAPGQVALVRGKQRAYLELVDVVAEPHPASRPF